MNVNDIKKICVVGAETWAPDFSPLRHSRVQNDCTDVLPEILKKAEKFADTYLPEEWKREK